METITQVQDIVDLRISSHIPRGERRLIMGRVRFIDPVLSVSGRISKKYSRTIYNHRNSWDYEGNNYTMWRLGKLHAPTAAEIAGRTKFRQAAQQTNTIMMDVEQLTPYRTAWRNQVKSGNHTYSTLRGYIFAQVYRTL